MNKYRIGFTGTQQGLSAAQKVVLSTFARKYLGAVSEFHHGDCIGADAEAHDIFIDARAIMIHPPTDPKKRAFKSGEFCGFYLPKPYLERNRDIVDACDVLIACPKEMHETLRSGTWATIRYARKVGKPVVIIYPDGTMYK